jgi:ABC-type dipeptide/oligopeptide/nickel transport system ATPase component
MGRRKTNVMVVGKTGSGKTAISVDVMRTFLSEPQLRGWRELHKGIQKDGKNAGDKDHDNQE